MTGPRPRLRRAAVTAPLLLLCGCAVAVEPRDVVTEFARAVQDDDAGALYCVSAGAVGAESLGADPAARREAFGRWLDEEIAAYEDGRDRGEVELSGHGVRLVKTFALGRGTFYQTAEEGALGEDGFRLRTRLEFGYAQIDLSRLSPGTTFYVATPPPGHLRPVVVPSRAKEVEVVALDSIMVDWTLVRAAAADGCAAGWRVASVEALPRTARTTSIKWIF